jgi:hypothetical protein
LISVGIFLYEDEEGKIQNRLEDLWLKVDDFQHLALSKHVALMRMIAGLMNTGFNWVFGKKLVSVESVAVSYCYSLASIDLVLVLVVLRWNPTQFSYRVLFSAISYLMFGTAFAYFRDSKWGRAICFGSLFVIILKTDLIPLVIMTLNNDYHLLPIPITIVLTVVFNTILFTLFIIVLRKSLYKISTSESAVKIGLISLLNLLPTIVVIGLVSLMLRRMLNSPLPSDFIKQNLLTNLSGSLTFFLVAFGTFAFFGNIIFAITAAISVLIAMAMLLHKIFWPVINRPIYALQKFGIAKRNKLFIACGLILIVASCGKYEWLERVLSIVS